MPLHHDTLLAAQYFTAVAGTAAMRHCLTRPSAVRERLEDVRRVVEHLDEFPNNLEIPVVEYGVDEGYAAWAPRYDGPNPAVEASRAAITALLDGVPPGKTLDAACGTGQIAGLLASMGHDVVGVDGSAAMLDRARVNVPTAVFHEGRLTSLPADDGSVDVVTCSLALTHVDDLAGPIAEMARILRPGGRIVMADVHPTAVSFGGTAIFPSGEEDFRLTFVRNLIHPVEAYVTAALAAGLAVAGCREIAYPESAIENNPAYPVVPDAVRQMFDGLPFVLAWRFEKPG